MACTRSANWVQALRGCDGENTHQQANLPRPDLHSWDGNPILALCLVYLEAQQDPWASSPPCPLLSTLGNASIPLRGWDKLYDRGSNKAWGNGLHPNWLRSTYLFPSQPAHHSVLCTEPLMQVDCGTEFCVKRQSQEMTLTLMTE